MYQTISSTVSDYHMVMLSKVSQKCVVVNTNFLTPGNRSVNSIFKIKKMTMISAVDDNTVSATWSPDMSQPLDTDILKFRQRRVRQHL